MQEEIMQLIQLQELDLKILEIENSMKEIPQELKKLKNQKEELLKKIEELETRIEEKQKQKNLFEEELKEEYNRLKSTQARLVQIRGTREYQFLLREIEEIKKANKQKEEEILQLMQEIDDMEKEKEEYKKNLSEIEKLLAEEEKKYQEFCDKLASQKAELLMKRETLSKKIPGKLLRRYEAIKKKKGGRGIVPVINAVCEGCNMAIPPQLYNELQRDNRYYECPYCKRLIFYKKIYLPEPEEEEPRKAIKG